MHTRSRGREVGVGVDGRVYVRACVRACMRACDCLCMYTYLLHLCEGSVRDVEALRRLLRLDHRRAEILRSKDE
jgi:hypothetical protein